MRLSWERLEDHEENVPATVRAAAKAFLLKVLLADPGGDVPEPEEVLSWRLGVLDLGYRRPPGAPWDVMDAIVEQTAVEELEEMLSDLYDEEPGLRHETFTLGDPKEGVIVLVRAPEQWWLSEPLKKLLDEGLLQDTSYGNDACPSLGAELMDGRTLRIFTGHPHPDHHTRQDGCDPRFAVFLGDKDWEIDWESGPEWQGESEEEAARQILRIMNEAGGPRRQLRMAGKRRTKHR